MKDNALNRWETARQGVLDRWRTILSRIDVRDEPGVLALANVMDEFCEGAALSREISGGGGQGTSGPPLKILTAGAPAGSRCFFCRGFLDIGGCFGLLDEVNRAVTRGDWIKARSVAETYVVRLEAMNFASAIGESVH